jgi:pimeloyl-ACP methyl ester carboxylesterase
MRIPVPGGEMAVAIEGEGDPVVFLHAFPLDRRMWDGAAGGLRHRYQVIRPDVRGFGESSGLEPVLAMERIADDVALLLDALALARAVIVGCSMGGYAALALARRQPERIRGLVLHDTRAGPDTEEARAKRLQLADRVLAEGVGPVVEAFLPKVLGPTSHARRPAVVAQVERWMAQAPPAAVAAALCGLAIRADSAPLLQEIGVPTLVICGAEDAVTVPAESELMHRAIRGSQLAIVPDAGHLSNLENPAVYHEALRGFLDALPA